MLRRVERRPDTLSEQIVETLVLDLQLQRIPPGAALREQDLAERFGVSRPAIREALKRLELRGCVDASQRRGVRAIAYTPDDLADLLEFHEANFSLTCRLAAERRTDVQMSDIRLQVSLLRQLARSGATAEDYEIARLGAYRRIELATGAAYELNQRRAFIRFFNPYSISAVQTAEQREASAARWLDLANLIDHRDGEGAAAQFRTMARATRPAILEACRASQPATAAHHGSESVTSDSAD